MSKESIIPIGEYLLIQPVKEAALGEIILGVNNGINNRGTILAVGDKVNTDEGSHPLDRGQIVVYIPNSGVKITNSEDSKELISVKNIIGIIEGE